MRNGHLAYPDGRRFRIWGVNITGPGNLPTHEDAATEAAHLARYGINCVRMHFLDRPGVLIDNTKADTRALDADHLDRLDFFVAELKKRGIYSDLNLNVARTYKTADGVKDPGLLGLAKALTYFDERLLALQREYANQLLTHFNPYTKAEYRDRARGAAGGTGEREFDRRVVGRQPSAREEHAAQSGDLVHIPASYEADLTAQYHAWLAKHGLPPEPRLRKPEIATAVRRSLPPRAEVLHGSGGSLLPGHARLSQG